MIRIFISALAVLALPAGAFADQHRCAADARLRAESLLKLHFAIDDPKGAGDLGTAAASPVENMSIDEKVRELLPVKALVGAGKFDVLEVYGYIYKATYRMHFIYAQLPDSCTLVGQEIIEQVDPY